MAKIMLTMSDEIKREIRKKAGENDKSMNQYILRCVEVDLMQNVTIDQIKGALVASEGPQEVLVERDGSIKVSPIKKPTKKTKKPIEKLGDEIREITQQISCQKCIYPAKAEDHSCK